MKNIITSFLCILSILLVLLNINTITDKIINFINPPNTFKIEYHNNYYKNNNYSFVTNTNDFTPYGKQDLLNIIYTIINSGTLNFTFYCPKEYTNCIMDMNDISKDANLLTHLNNFVHPFNSFTSINTTLSDSGEINLKVSYLYSDEEIKAINTKVNNLLKELIEDDIDSETPDYDTIKIIHDYIINNTKYDIDNNKENKSYNAYGPLFNSLATCNGYTDLMAIFLSNMGYNNFKIATTNGDEKNVEGHVWNAVEINGEWLHLDLTWDDPVSSDGKDYLYHKYFLINTEELNTADSNITSTEHNFDPSIYTELKTEKETN
ncbi:MAG: hypothetical protein NC483_01230 [Ruminococcus sp.]|nr:hypothetical protein [Ruminococcus sp.]